MTREEIMTLGFEDLEKRAGEIATETAEADKEMIESLNAELDAIEERKMALNLEIEERKKAAEAVANGAGKEVEERTEKKMTDREIRSTQEYVDAYAELVKKGYDLEKVGAEKRALLSENTVGGTIAVPTFVEERINTAWENNEILRRVRRTYLPGNVKVGVEVSASSATLHLEGGDPVSPENLEIVFVDLIPQFAKKLVEVSHTVLEMGPRDFLDYLFDEIEYQIIKLIGAAIVNAVVNSTYTYGYSMSGANLTTADIIGAQAHLAGDANPVLITTRAQAADLKAAALTANYAYDPFDGLEVIYCESGALDGKDAIVVDLSGVQANFPDGDQPKFIFDEFTKADENIVRIVGRLAFAASLVATGKAVALYEDEGE